MITRLMLVGQPNCGKSTIFNSVSGYKVKTGNFPGVTVKYIESRVRIDGSEVIITDLPGIYSLYPSDEAERQTLDYLLTHDGVIVNVIDASVLSRSLELTLELMELHAPMVIALNMMDEARRKGIEINVKKLEKILGVPVIPTIGHKGVNLTELMRAAITRAKPPYKLMYGSEIEEMIEKVDREIEDTPFNRRFTAFRILCGDRDTLERYDIRYTTQEIGCKENFAEEERHKKAMEIFEKVATLSHASVSPRERIDGILMHPVLGYAALILIFGGMLWISFLIGDFLSGLIIDPIDGWRTENIAVDTAGGVFVSGIMDGIIGGLGIVLPYMVPMLIMLEFLEDVGYTSRAAFLLDRMFHRIGMHGKVVGPFLLGYGCSVPAILATRIIEDPWERLKAAVLIPLIPCSARTVIILALIASLFGPLWALFFYGFNIMVIAIAGYALRSRMGGTGIGLVMEMPDLKIPSIRVIAHKVYLIVYDFSIVAWPIIIVGSVVMAYMDYCEVSPAVNAVLSPLTVLALGLPVALGITLIFGIFRKELALFMTYAALGLSLADPASILGVMTPQQIFVFVTFITFFIPCFSTLAVLYREFGLGKTLLISGINLVIALAAAIIIRISFYAGFLL